MKSAIYGLKPASCALIASVALRLIKTSVTGLYELLLFGGLLFIFLTQKKSPIFYLVVSGLVGLILKLMAKV